MADLPDADELHGRFFDRWSKPADRARRLYAATRHDVVCVAGFREVPSEELSPIPSERQRTVTTMLDRMVAAARSDWKAVIAPHDVLSRDGLMAIDHDLDVPRVRQLIDASEPGDVANDYFVTACELGAVLGATLRSARPTFQWVPDWPYWESSLVDRRSGHVVAPFHWAIRRMSATACDVALIEKIGACLELLARTKR